MSNYVAFMLGEKTYNLSMSILATAYYSKKATFKKKTFTISFSY